MHDALNDGGSRKKTHGVTKTGGARGAAHDETRRKPNAIKPTTRHGATKSERERPRAKARAPHPPLWGEPEARVLKKVRPL